MSSSRAEEIGQTYDAVPYDPGPAAALSLARVRGALAVFGLPSGLAAPAVLDIGCGAGAQLLLAAQEGAGRLVGIDASEVACTAARARGAGLGERWRILHADAAAIDPASLGSFDVIYLLGTLYIMPPAAREQVLALIAGCLRPGGVAVINYYTGIHGVVRMRLGELLRTANDPGWRLGLQVSTARANLAALAAVVPPQGPTREIVTSTLTSMQNATDTVLFHEALGPVYDPVHTAGLHAGLAAQGVEFLNYLPPIPVQPNAGPTGAARAAEAWDFASGGGYRTALFVRPFGAMPAIARPVRDGMRHPGLVWSTALKPGPDQGGVPSYVMPGGGGIQANTPAAHGILDSLATAPCRWTELHAAAAARDAASDEHGDAVDNLLVLLWQAGMAWPEIRRT